MDLIGDYGEPDELFFDVGMEYGEYTIFNSRRLSGNFKAMLGGQIVNHEVTIKKMSENHHLPRSTLKKYARKVREHTRIYEKPGRHPALDKRSLAAIREQIEFHGLPSDGELRNLIQEEYVQTCVRHCRPDDINNYQPRMRKTSR